MPKESPRSQGLIKTPLRAEKFRCMLAASGIASVDHRLIDEAKRTTGQRGKTPGLGRPMRLDALNAQTLKLMASAYRKWINNPERYGHAFISEGRFFHSTAIKRKPERGDPTSRVDFLPEFVVADSMKRDKS